MALLKNSQQQRDELLSKNIYKPNDIYDLTNDNVTKTLNFLDNLGFNLRTNVVARIIEAQVDNTPLVQIANRRLVTEFGRRVTTNIIKDKLPIVSIGNLLDKDPTTPFLLKQVDFKITPDLKKDNSLDKIFSTLKTGFGYTSFKTALDREDLSSYDYYKILGEGQKKVLNNNILRNYYNGYIPSVRSERNTINFYLDGRTLPKDSINTYTKVGLPKDQDFDYIADLKEGTDGIASHIPRGDGAELAQDEMGFGRTKDKGSEGQNQLIWGDSISESLGVKRGLLHYTNQIVNENLKVSKNINMNTKFGYTDHDGKVYYKGVECRSWTVNDKYDSYSKLIRNKGNGVNYSVLKESVIPKQHPVLSDSREDKKRFLFSMENLAWTKQDLIEAGIDENHPEHGYHNGRLMWFPFYGVTYSETTDVSINDTMLLGRIEPLYSYSHRVRTATLSFMLIMDYPPNIETFVGNESNFFKGCNVDYTSNKIVINGGNTVEEQSTITTGITRQVEQQIEIPNTLKYHFENDSFSIDPTYEISEEGQIETPQDTKNLYALNFEYQTNLEEYGVFFASEDLEYCDVELKGFTSKLSTNNYNARLGFKRAYTILQDVLNEAGILSKLESPDNFVDNTFTKFRAKNGSLEDITNQNLDTIKFIFKIGRTNITLTSKGENTAIGGSGIDSQDRTLETLNDRQTKEDRRAEMNVVNVRKKYATETFPEEITVNTVRQKNEEELQRDTEVYGDFRPNLYPFELRDIVSNSPVSKGYENIKYFQPAYHSQTPEDFHKRLTFLEQLTSVGKSINKNNGQNSVFGKMPVTILRLGDFIHSKIVIKTINKEITDESPWDMNPEGMGFQPMVAKITMGFDIIGGQSLQTPINSLQRAIDFNFYANSTYYGSSYYGGKPKTQSDEELNFQRIRNN